MNQVALCPACSDPAGHAAALHSEECAALRQLFNSPHTRLQELGADAAADGGRAGVRLLLRLVYARARHRRIRVSAWQGDGAQLPASPAMLSDLDVIEDSYPDVWALEEHWEDFSDEVADRLVDMAKQAKFVTGAEARGNLEESVSLLSHCYSNAFKLPCPLTVSAGTADTNSGKVQRSIGVGVFVSAALLNHSCDPNCAWAIDQHGFLTVTTRCAVLAGDQLTISYIESNNTMTLQARRARLQNDFFFVCRCRRCKEEEGGCGGVRDCVRVGKRKRS